MRSAGCRQPEIAVDNLNVLWPPTQIQSALLQGVLQPQALLIGEDLMRRRLSDVLSRDSIGLSKNTSHTGTTPSAISSIAIATSIVSSSARRSAWRRRASSSSRAAICPAGSPRLLAPARARSWLANICRNAGTALFFGWACTHPKHTNPFGQYSPVGRAHRCVPISRKLQLAANAAHSSAGGLRKLSSPWPARYAPYNVFRYSSTRRVVYSLAYTMMSSRTACHIGAAMT